MLLKSTVHAECHTTIQMKTMICTQCCEYTQCCEWYHVSCEYHQCREV